MWFCRSHLWTASTQDTCSITWQQLNMALCSTSPRSGLQTAGLCRRFDNVSGSDERGNPVTEVPPEVMESIRRNRVRPSRSGPDPLCPVRGSRVASWHSPQGKKVLAAPSFHSS